MRKGYNWRVLCVTVLNHGVVESRVIYESEVTIGKSADDNIRLPVELVTALPDNFRLFNRNDDNVYMLYSCDGLNILVWRCIYSHPRQFSDIAQNGRLELGDGAHGEVRVVGTDFTVDFRVDTPPPECI